MRKQTIKIVAAVLGCAVGTACSSGDFHIKGSISNAKDSTLTLEQMSINDIIEVSTVKLKEDGSFTLKGAAPLQGPEFYRLRIGDQIVNLVIDSTETITVKGEWPNLSSRYEVNGSEECNKIRQLSLKQIALQDSVIALSRRGGISPSQYEEKVLSMLEQYKEWVTDSFIIKAPWSASAYFALFQTLGNMLIFNPRTSASDVRLFAAVATSWDTYHPGHQRTENLHSIALEGMRLTRRPMGPTPEQQEQLNSLIEETGSIDIPLRDNKGQLRHLHDLKGKVVLLDFHIFAQAESAQRILLLQELYSKYHERGLEIYQVSVDTDEHFWRQRTDALPWICVRDEDALDSRWLGTYNVTQLPEFFLLDRNCGLVKRSGQITDIDAEISRLL